MAWGAAEHGLHPDAPGLGARSLSCPEECAAHLRDLVEADVATRADRTLPAHLRQAASERLVQFRAAAEGRLVVAWGA